MADLNVPTVTVKPAELKVKQIFDKLDAHYSSAPNTSGEIGIQNEIERLKIMSLFQPTLKKEKSTYTIAKENVCTQGAIIQSYKGVKF